MSSKYSNPSNYATNDGVNGRNGEKQNIFKANPTKDPFLNGSHKGGTYSSAPDEYKTAQGIHGYTGNQQLENNGVNSNYKNPKGNTFPENQNQNAQRNRKSPSSGNNDTSKYKRPGDALPNSVNNNTCLPGFDPATSNSNGHFGDRKNRITDPHSYPNETVNGIHGKGVNNIQPNFNTGTGNNNRGPVGSSSLYNDPFQQQTRIPTEAAGGRNKDLTGGKGDRDPNGSNATGGIENASNIFGKNGNIKGGPDYTGHNHPATGPLHKMGNNVPDGSGNYRNTNDPLNGLGRGANDQFDKSRNVNRPGFSGNSPNPDGKLPNRKDGKISDDKGYSGNANNPAHKMENVPDGTGNYSKTNNPLNSHMPLARNGTDEPDNNLSNLAANGLQSPNNPTHTKRGQNHPDHDRNQPYNSNNSKAPRKLISFRQSDPMTAKFDKDGNPFPRRQSFKHDNDGPFDDDGIESYNADNTLDKPDRRPDPRGNFTVNTGKPAWKTAQVKGPRTNKGTKTPVENLTFKRHSLTEPDPVFTSDRLAKKFPFLDAGANNDQKANKNIPTASNTGMRKNKSDTALVFRGQDTLKPSNNTKKDFPDIPNTLSGEDAELAKQIAAANPEMRDKIFYGFGVGKWRLMATTWLNKWKMKKKPMKTEDSVWE